MFNTHDITRNEFMLHGPLAHNGYDWWWHSFTAYNKKTKEAKPFYIEFFLCNPKLTKDEPVFGQLKENQEKHLIFLFFSHIIIEKRLGMECKVADTPG